MKTATEPYVTIKSFPHYGEHFVIIGKKDDKLIGKSLDCKHNTQTLEITKEDI
jgi:hypothetical protein